MANAAARVLIADDEPALLKMIKLYLDRLGYAVTVARTAEGASAEVQSASGAFDVAVVDATMGGADLAGFVLRMLDASPRLCVLVASGYPVDMSAVEESAGPRAAFLLKPFAPEALDTAIRRILAAQERAL
jgi:two-component system, cell cycle response regulator